MDSVEGRWRRAAGQTLCLELRGDACVYGALTGWRGNVQLDEDEMEEDTAEGGAGR